MGNLGESEVMNDSSTLGKSTGRCFLNFAGKWMELENIILSEVTQTQNDNDHMYSLISGF